MTEQSQQSQESSIQAMFEELQAQARECEAYAENARFDSNEEAEKFWMMAADRASDRAARMIEGF